MSKRDKPIRLGRGFTVMYVTVCLTEKAYLKAVKGRKDAGPFPHELHASTTFFEARKHKAPFCVVTISPFYLKHGSNVLAMLAHEFIHCKQWAEKTMGTTFDTETEPYYVQHLMQAAWVKIKPFAGR